MRVSISRGGPIPIGEQLADQIRHQIEDATLPSGEKLPTLRALAASLGINYNTVRGVYSRLVGSGHVESLQGRGTFVAARPARKREAALTRLRDLVDEGISRALAAGLSADEFARMVYARTALIHARRRRVRILLVECNAADLRVMASEVREATGIAAATATVDELEKKDRAYFRPFDLIATTFSHLGQTQKLVGRSRAVIGLMVEPSYPEVLADIAALDDDAMIGLVCFRQAGAEGMLRTLRGTGMDEKRFVPAGLDQPGKISDVFARADRVYASGAYLDEKGEGALEEDRRIRPYAVHVTPSSLAYLRQHIESLTPETKS